MSEENFEFTNQERQDREEMMEGGHMTPEERRMMDYQPNLKYYDLVECYFDKCYGFSPDKLAEFGKRNKFPSGRTFILGKWFIIIISFAADTYDNMSEVTIYVQDNYNIKKYKALEQHLLLYKYTRHALDSLDIWLNNIGINMDATPVRLSTK